MISKEAVWEEVWISLEVAWEAGWISRAAAWEASQEVSISHSTTSLYRQIVR